VSALRFTPEAAAAMRAAIRDAGGIEIFAVGEVEGTEVTAIEVHARGTEDAVLALQSRPRHGQVVIHNHPSGVVRPSEADLSLAGNFGEDGVGFVIVDNAVTRSLWVVEPARKTEVAVDPGEVEAFFTQTLLRAMPGWEPRPGQVAMALRVAETLHVGGLVVLEAGTGTGKSLAYLVPAALWALANKSKVVVSTYTRTLQAQLVRDDLPMVQRALGPTFKHAVLKGRNNYLCRRKLEIAGRDAEGTAALRRVVDWAATTVTGDISDAGFEVDDETWDLVESDTDQTLRARCPHFNTCFYYQARRAAAAAHLVVANHALLLADLAMKGETQGSGILPRFDRVILDEAHHLEQAATSVSAVRISARTVARAVAPLLPRGRRPGALDRLGRFDAVAGLIGETLDAVTAARDTARVGFGLLGEGRTQPERVRGPVPEEELIVDLADELSRAAARLGAIEAGLQDVEIPATEAQPFLDLGRARRRLEGASEAARAFLVEDPTWCRYLDPGSAGIAAARAPVDVGPFLRRTLQEGQHATVLTSATLAVHGKIDHYLGRVGLAGDFETYPSPFDYARQAVLALPRDLPPPTDPGFVDAVTPVLVDALRASRGGAFVLCTSHAAVQELSARVGAVLRGEHAILVQGKGARTALLEQFRRDRGAVLFGTDSFWEGVSVRGDGLRLVVIPRLPFRVPTEPVAEARYERLKAAGLDPFRAYALPEAVIKLRQGFGRLVRSQTDRGAVLVLDRRIHEVWYGRIFLASLPPARRVVGPSRAVLEELRRLFR
jgi:ATP-dependent DNA helicase DinG